MLMTPAKPQIATAVSTPIQQICITHCLREEGVYRQAGFTVRAASTLDPLLLRFAMEYPSYELPAGMTGEKQLAAPRRLALVRIPGGQSALIHSVHVPNERGRANNFFSHVLVRPALTAREALTCWGSPAWRTSCAPDEGTDLPPFDELPVHSAVNDAALTTFLQPVVSGTEKNQALPTCPERLAKQAERRRQLVQLALRGCLLAVQAGATAARSRFDILAEPGLTVLLLYAAARLMPDALAANLTFSTYENAHRDLRVYKHARVAGTYLTDPSRGLPAELFTTRGYALDTFAHQFSAELRGDAEPAVEEWIDLAARGDWTTIDKVQRLLGKSNTALMPFKEGVQAAKIAVRMGKGQANSDDLLALKRAAWGSAILDEHQEKIWPLVRDSSVSDERIRREFAPLIRQHLPEVEAEVAKALAEAPPGQWQPSWRLLCSILADDPPRLRETLQGLLPEPPYPAGLRVALLGELERCQLSPLDPRAPAHALLKSCTAEELDQLAQSRLPSEWFALALLYAFTRPESRAAAVRLLHNGDDELLAPFWEHFRLIKDESQRRTILAALFPPDTPEGCRFLERFLAQRTRLRVETLEWLLDSFEAFSRERSEFWGRDNHLGMVLELLRVLGEEAAPLWERLCSLIDPLLLAPGDAFQNTLLMELAAINDRPGPPLPRGTAQVIADWVLLREHFERATEVPEGTRRQVIDACKRLHFEAIDVLGRYFERFVLPQGENKAVLDDFIGFFHSFFLAGRDYQDYSSRLIAWLHIVSCCPDESRRAVFQRHYLENQVPLEFRWRLAEETHHAGRLLTAVFEQMQKMRPHGAAETLTAEPSTPAVAPIDDLFQLSGIPAADADLSLLASVGKRAPWLLGTLAGGLLAAWLSARYRIQLQRVAAMILFIPLILALAESMVLQSMASTWRGLRDETLTRAVLIRRSVREMLTGLLLGLLCGVIVTATAGVWTRSWPLALSMGAALTGGLAGAAGLGCALPVLTYSMTRGRWLASAPIARSLAVFLVLLLYFALSCLFIR
jgi:hypothetical protein